MVPPLPPGGPARPEDAEFKYRLKRIRDLSGYDLTDPDTAFNLERASRAWRTLELMRAS